MRISYKRALRACELFGYRLHRATMLGERQDYYYKYTLYKDDIKIVESELLKDIMANIDMN